MKQIPFDILISPRRSSLRETFFVLFHYNSVVAVHKLSKMDFSIFFESLSCKIFVEDQIKITNSTPPGVGGTALLQELLELGPEKTF